MHPTAFNLGSLTVTWYGVMVATAFLVGLYLASRRARHSEIAAQQVADLGPWLILGAIAGARAMYVVMFWHEDFAGKPIWEIFMIRHGGLVFYGGLFGAVFATWLFILIKKLATWKMADVLAPSIPLGYAIGRIGCLLNGCCYGRPTDVPWAIRFPAELHPTQGVPVHPTQIYDSLCGIGLYMLLAWLFQHRKFDGHVFGVFLVGYAMCRSLVECFRGDYPADKFIGPFTPAQASSAVVLFCGVVLLVVLGRRKSPAHR